MAKRIIVPNRTNATFGLTAGVPVQLVGRIRWNEEAGEHNVTVRNLTTQHTWTVPLVLVDPAYGYSEKEK